MWNGAHKRAAEAHTYIAAHELASVQQRMEGAGYVVSKAPSNAVLVMQHPHYVTPLTISKFNGNVLIVPGSGVAIVKKFLAVRK